MYMTIPILHLPKDARYDEPARSSGVWRRNNEQRPAPTQTFKHVSPRANILSRCIHAPNRSFGIPVSLLPNLNSGVANTGNVKLAEWDQVLTLLINPGCVGHVQQSFWMCSCVHYFGGAAGYAPTTLQVHNDAPKHI